ncbi:hypothetical protein BV20DRAFT_232574 [Pilatotrama ljubarskyi]|nr:hypothetical protein BV20DRAFT_232574 [Pilatotrama ljubarskyi]
MQKDSSATSRTCSRCIGQEEDASRMSCRAHSVCQNCAESLIWPSPGVSIYGGAVFAVGSLERRLFHRRGARGGPIAASGPGWRRRRSDSVSRCGGHVVHDVDNACLINTVLVTTHAGVSSLRIALLWLRGDIPPRPFYLDVDYAVLASVLARSCF